MFRRPNYGFTTIEIAIVMAILAVAGFVTFRIIASNYRDQDISPSPAFENASEDYDVYPEVWTKNGYEGPSYEFKVNCGPDYETLKECFLWDLSKVVVADPDSKKFKLDKDFNVNEYSGEITRRWVLYGEANKGFPKAGQYTFSYYRNKKLVYEQSVDYQPEIIGYPTNIKWQRTGNDLKVTWQPPDGIEKGMWYKVIIFHDDGNVTSQQVDWDASEAVLKNMPLKEGEEVDMNVSSYFSGGYAYPESVIIVW